MASDTRADIVDIAWNADGRFERNVHVAPGQFAGFCGQLPAGLKVGRNFQASMSLGFNAPHHIGKEVVFPLKFTAVVTEKTLARIR